MTLINREAFLPYEAISLNNLGNLWRSKKEFRKAENSYQEAIKIRRKLVKINPQTYLPHLAISLYNLGVLLRSKKEFYKAEKSYLEAMQIRIDFAKLNPKVFELSLANVYLALSNLYKKNLPDSEKSKEYAAKAVELYKNYWDSSPPARKWGDIAKKNL